MVSGIPGRHFVRNLVERRALVAQLVRRDFESRYKGSAAGWLWGAIHPLVMLGSWVFVFQTCLKQPVPEGARNFPLFLFCGYLPWLLFQETVIRSTGSMVEQANLITKTVFPSEVVPLSIFLSSLIQHLIGVALAVLGDALFFKSFSPLILWLPLYMVFAGLLGVGVGWVAASLHVYMRDTAQVVSVLLQLWFWLTPIMIPETAIPARLRFLVTFNPMARLVNAYRGSLIFHVWPEPKNLLILAASSAAVFVVGGLFFRHLKSGFADVL